MLSRLLGAFIGALILGAISFGVITAFNPATLAFTEPIFCTDPDQRMVIRTVAVGDGEFTIHPQCVNSDNIVVKQLSDFNVVLVACAGYMLPIFLALFIFTTINNWRNPAKPTIIADSGVVLNVHKRNLTPAERDRLRYDDPLYTEADKLQFLEDARRDGRLSQEDYERIRNKIVLNAVSQPMQMLMNDNFMTLSEKLQQLRDAYDQGVITHAEYDAKREEILDEF